MGRTKVNSYTINQNGDKQYETMQMLELLDLPTAAASLEHIHHNVIRSKGTPYDFLHKLLEAEVTAKEERRIERWIQLARFPALKTIDGFDFSMQPSLDPTIIQELRSCRFIKKGQNVIFFGPPGVGKTHLSIALGIEAIQRGFEARFFTLDLLLAYIHRYEGKPTGIDGLLQTLRRPKLLILDDIDHEAPTEQAKLFLAKLLRRRDEDSHSTILSSNASFEKWTHLFPNDKEASAIVDRLSGEGSFIIIINGDSYRQNKKLK